jgi:hypothetical protein
MNDQSSPLRGHIAADPGTCRLPDGRTIFNLTSCTLRRNQKALENLVDSLPTSIIVAGVILCSRGIFLSDKICHLPPRRRLMIYNRCVEFQDKAEVFLHLDATIEPYRDYMFNLLGVSLERTWNNLMASR